MTQFDDEAKAILRNIEMKIDAEEFGYFDTEIPQTDSRHLVIENVGLANNAEIHIFRNVYGAGQLCIEIWDNEGQEGWWYLNDREKVLGLIKRYLRRYSKDK